MGHVIRDYLTEHGLTVQQLADALGVNRVTVHRWLKSDEPPRLVALALKGLGKK